MTDAQLCEYLDSLSGAGAPAPAGPSKEEIIAAFLDGLAVRRGDGLRVSDATIPQAPQHGAAGRIPPSSPGRRDGPRMSLHRKKITLRVTSQTAYHLEEMAAELGKTEGQLIDAMVAAARKGTERMPGKGRVKRETTKNKPKQ